MPWVCLFAYMRPRWRFEVTDVSCVLTSLYVLSCGPVLDNSCIVEISFSWGFIAGAFETVTSLYLTVFVEEIRSAPVQAASGPEWGAA